MTTEQMQAMVNCAALELWALEDLINNGGDPVQIALATSLHAKALALLTVLAKEHSLTIPTPSTRSGGGGK